MSLGLNYSSDEEILNAVSKDAFGLSSLPVAKKPRTEEPAAMAMSTDAAPHVLSEVSVASVPFFDDSKS
jgi:pre-mRNA-processing factor 17